MIDSWFDKQSDRTPTPPEVQQSWMGEESAEQNEVTYTSGSRDLFAVRNERSKVTCWMYDKDKQLYLAKKRNGKLEYFKRPQDFCLMPKFDIRSINNDVFYNPSKVFYNPSKDSQAELFAKFIKEQCDKDFPTMNTAKGKQFISSCILDPVKKEQWIYFKYPPPATKKAVPVSTRVPDNMLQNFDLWYFDEKTHAATIMRTKGDIHDVDIILDPIDLLKFGKDDMQKLHDTPIKVNGGWDEEAKPFTQVFFLCHGTKAICWCKSSFCHTSCRLISSV
ncbi:hypothetical protein R6Q59_029519 [Mikania micrantha]